MDPVSALAGTTQIAAQCHECVLTLTKWINQVNKVDARINALKEEILTLQLTYDKLSTSMKEPIILEAACHTDREAGGLLWSQVCVVLNDCQATLIDINRIFEHIGQSGKKVVAIMKTLTESLSGGELARRRERIQLFNLTLELPLQLVNLTLQIQQKDAESSSEKKIFFEITFLNDNVDSLGQRVGHLLRMYGWSGSTLAGEVSTEGKIYQHIETMTKTSKQYLAKAPAAVADYRELPSATSPRSAPVRDSNARMSITSGTSSSHYGSSHTRTLTSSSTAAVDTMNYIDEDEESDQDNDVELELTLEYLENGRNDIDQRDYENAEANFRAALEMIEDNNFSRKLSYTAADVSLLIADCCLKTEKYEDAIELLEPIADAPEQSMARRGSVDPSSLKNQTLPSTSDQILALKASHVIALCFFKKCDYPNAEKRGKEAFKGRRKLLQPHHPMTLETVQLLIDIYKAKDDQVNARAYRRFLDPPTNLKSGGRRKSLPAIPGPNTQDTLSSPIETKHPVDAFDNVPVEPDPLPPNLPLIARKKLSWQNPFGRMSKIDEFGPPLRSSTLPVAPDQIYESSSRNSSTTFPATSPMAQKTDRYSHGRSKSMAVYHDLSTQPSIDEIVRSYSHQPRPSISSHRTNSSIAVPAEIRQYTRQELAPKFQAIRSLRQEHKTKHSIEAALRLMKEYEPDRKTLIVREAELKKNMSKSDKGLASTGHGFAPIHFFCEQKTELVNEVELLLEHDVDINAVAYKAGMPGTDPFTPLQRAIERGHTSLVRMLIKAGVSLAPPKLPKGAHMSQVDREALQPLLMAVTRGQAEVAYMLLEAGASPEIHEFPLRMWHGNSLLHQACWLGEQPMVKMLLDYQMSHLNKAGAKIIHGRGKEWVKKIGKPGQQDHFGATPLMYAIDLRDCSDDQMRTAKAASRAQCLRLLLEHEIHGEIHTQSYRESVAKMLALKWTRGPAQGHSIFCYADSTGDPQLVQLLDPFRFQCNPEERCAAKPKRCTRKTNALAENLPHHRQNFVELIAEIPEPPMLQNEKEEEEEEEEEDDDDDPLKKSNSTSSTIADSSAGTEGKLTGTVSSITTNSSDPAADIAKRISEAFSWEEGGDKLDTLRKSHDHERVALRV